LKGLTSLLSLCALFGVVPVACLYDGSDRCGPNQVSITNDRCACADGYIPGDNGCVACGENEIALNGACSCAEGYARANPTEPCEKPPAELGLECDTESSPCPDETYPVCHEVDGTSGYCTNLCETSDDCDGAYKCQEGPEPFCRRPPVGVSDPCDTDEECAGKDASICEKIQSHQCLVPCGPGDTAGCFVGDACCEFPGPFIACVPADACIPSNFGMVVE
jgi:hypothetical protein